MHNNTTFRLSLLVSTCKDKKKNKDETDIDCGGNKCAKCADKKKCKVDQDCISDFCNKKKCTRKY